MTVPLIVDGRAITARLALVRDDGTSTDLGRISHEVTARDLFDSLPDRDTDDDAVLVLELWEEDERVRWLRDEREVDREIADALVDGRLDELLAGV